MEVNEPKLLRGFFTTRKGKYKTIPRRLRRSLIERLYGGMSDLGLGANRIAITYERHPGFGFMLAIIFARIEDDELPQGIITMPVLKPLGLDDPEVKKIMEEVVNPVCQDVLGQGYMFELSTD